MTLIELLKQIRGIESRMVTTEGIPLKMYGKNCEVLLKLCGDNGNYWVEVKPNIEHDEKVAVIMQMFEDGTNDSIAMAVANKIKQGVIDKACEWMTNYFVKYLQFDEQIVKDFRKAMEE